MAKLNFFLCLLNLSVVCVCFVCAEDNKFAQLNRNDRLNANGQQSGFGWSQSAEDVTIERKHSGIFFQIVFEGSRPTKVVVPFKDYKELFESHSKISFLLPNVTLMICFSVVFGYMIYIILALMCRQPVIVDDRTNPALKVLFTELAFRDGIIPAKLRSLYGQLDYESSETLLDLQKTNLSPKEDELTQKKSCTAPDHVFTSTA